LEKSDQGPEIRMQTQEHSQEWLCHKGSAIRDQDAKPGAA